jgi:glutamate-5-semialdehyde dehydrogenase
MIEMEIVKKQVIDAKNASKKMNSLTNNDKNEILFAIAKKIEENIDDIIFRNDIDIEAGKKANLSNAFIDRLKLTEKSLKQIAESVRNVASLEDPIGEVIDTNIVENGLKINKIRQPLGVIGIIYESRPNVTIDTIALCIKSGNAVILKGGKEALNSNHILARLAVEAAEESGLPEGAIQFIETSNRDIFAEILKMDKFIDVIIPRGSQEMIENITEISKIPVIKHGKGLCHIYVDEFANIEMAIDIIKNAKIQRPGVCNAVETVLVNETIANEFLLKFLKDLEKNNIFNLELRLCEIGLNKIANIDGFKLLSQNIKNNIKSAEKRDWDTEYLDMILSLKIVNNLDEAIEHIDVYGTGHSEAIITENEKNAETFLKMIDASAVYHNASTRFTDGGCFGLGAEMGISTQKLHARGPMGIKELTSYKYVVYGNGQIRK